jgi:uncharacterized protein
MDIVLNDIEVRILGCLIEKETTTPEYYPLSLNSLTNACNQKSNRHPVVSLDEAAVEEGLSSLQTKGLARKTLTAGSRVTKYLHTLLDKFDLSGHEMAVLCELLLRGPQTLGELRSHAERMARFEDLDTIDKTLQVLIAYDPPLVMKLPRETGRKENRHMHLLSGNSVPDLAAEPVAAQMSAQERIMRLEEETAQLRAELEDLKKTFSEFRAQF